MIATILRQQDNMETPKQQQHATITLFANWDPVNTKKILSIIKF